MTDVVRATLEENGRSLLRAAIRTFTFSVHSPDKQTDLQKLVDSRVRVDGACVPLFNRKRQRLTSGESAVTPDPRGTGTTDDGQGRGAPSLGTTVGTRVGGTVALRLIWLGETSQDP